MAEPCRRRRRPRPLQLPQRAAAVVEMGLLLAFSALAGTACALLSRRPAPAPMGGLPALRWGRASPLMTSMMTALQPERPQQQLQPQASSVSGSSSAWHLLPQQPPPPPVVTLQRYVPFCVLTCACMHANPSIPSPPPPTHTYSSPLTK